MSLVKSVTRRMYRSTWGRKIFCTLPSVLAARLDRAGLPKLAWLLAKFALRHTPKNAKTLRILADALDHLGRHDAANDVRAQRLRQFLPKSIKNKDLTAILINMAKMERTHRSVPLKAAALITSKLESDDGRKHILKHALASKRRIQISAFTTHLITLCMARNGDYRAASRMLRDEIRNFQANDYGDKALQRKRLRILEQSWRMVDLIARENMDWPDEPDSGAMLSSAQPKAAPAASNEKETGGNARDLQMSQPSSADLRLSKELALQGRHFETYLQLCDDDFEAATSLRARLKAISDILRIGLRRMPSYAKAHDLARRRLMQTLPEINANFAETAFADVKQATETVLDLCAVLKLARHLKETDLAADICRVLDEMSQRPGITTAFWPAPSTIVADQKDLDVGDRIMARLSGEIPKINREVQHFFRWAELTWRHDAAHDMFQKLPKNLRRRQGVLYYINILQRDGRFEEALALLPGVHAQSLANPSGINAFTNNSLIKRAAELEFLIQTAAIYSEVPQPKDPKGIILFGPRNIDQLRRYPLMVLLEFKRRGWAVVPIVEGFLPREETGDPAIDVMIGAVSPTLRFSPEADQAMRPVEDFHFAPEKGLLKWGDVDLSHSLWEDAAINRRRYNIDWSCPELQKYLGGLSGWTGAMARVLQYARDHHDRSKLPVGCISLVNCRLPDSLFRFYCEQHGDPDHFFYLHTANGYQNYFTNFSTNISQRLVMRNMTKYPHVRSASFPLPENYEPYYNARQKSLPQIMERFAGITKVKRSTEGNTGRPPEANDVDARIQAWRKKGGRVACAFGKVVCDSGVPFDGGPAHANMKDWINHCIRAVKGSDTLLLIKPHPHELNNQIATFPTEYFIDLIEEPLGEQAIFLGHRWFDMHDMESRMDLGLIYNGTTAVELGIMGIPSILAGHFAPIDYPVGHTVPKDRAHFEALLRNEAPLLTKPDLRERSAVWLDYMANEEFTQSYRYHARPVTNKVLYPPYWFGDDLKANNERKDPAIAELIGRAIGENAEPGGQLR